ncbi:hypothetical protein DCO58_07310 [Helicobacter saguini]|uniref:Uncharacterized protein n=1 Tax=Helicobacter saguini TaxID=1548018 RepID=A0A347VN90_9HELI|nr:tetratricopeptide repeat protein [Helicobacter saguini]MWV61859.1 hypothetical protein [Helicobacter saguini]MWV67466.1 hypothetical protein [Helicobacter saguini]MWV69817.1 hypothetical protein [Helicobacter saguini]MWV72965.1 hypothetical protein [Helicobacter saguini]TLD95655.1 hypothetical protein LS64_002030 [Helicobacter saguini]
MSRKLLTLGYIYEMMGKSGEAIMCFEQVLEKDSKKLDASVLKEARIGIKANQMMVKHRKNRELITRNMNMRSVEQKLEIFSENPRKLIGWFSKWN